MPRVASEAHSVLPARPHQPVARSHSDARGSASPFNEILDSAAPPADPAPRQERVERQERTERQDPPARADKPKPADDRRADSKAADDSADVKDSKAADSADRAGSDDQDGKESKTADAAAEAKGDAAKASDNKSDPEADKSTALNALFADATAPVATAQQPITAAVAPALTLDAAPGAGGSPTEDVLAAIAVAGQDSAKIAGAKQAPAAQTGNAGEPSSKDAVTADTQTATPQIEAVKDGQTRSHDDKAPGSFHRAAAELIAKLGANKPDLDSGDAATAKAGTDAVQNAGALTPAGVASAAAVSATAAPAQTQAPSVAVPLSGLAVEIASQASSGKHHFEIRLDPADLGRIEVKLEIDRDGNVSTRLVVDRPDTLDLLKRDASTLERALQQAGLKTSDHGLDFSLRQHALTQDDKPSQNGARVIVSDDDTAPLEALRQGYGRLLGLSGGLDIRV